MVTHRQKPSVQESAQKRRIVLIVDADSARVFRISVLLIRLHYNFFSVVTGKEALEKAGQDGPSCIITPLDLPDMKGGELIRQIHQNPLAAQVPIIVVADGETDLTKRCPELGAITCLAEPIDPETLHAALQSAIEKKPRAHIRMKTVHAVKVYGSEHESLYGAYTLALSEGGMFLRTMSPVAVKTSLSLEFNLEGRTIAAEAEVVYNCQSGCGPDREKGIGLRFTEIGSGDQDYIRKFINNGLMKGIVPTRNPRLSS